MLMAEHPNTVPVYGGRVMTLPYRELSKIFPAFTTMTMINQR